MIWLRMARADASKQRETMTALKSAPPSHPEKARNGDNPEIRLKGFQGCHRFGRFPDRPRRGISGLSLFSGPAGTPRNAKPQLTSSRVLSERGQNSDNLEIRPLIRPEKARNGDNLEIRFR